MQRQQRVIIQMSLALHPAGTHIDIAAGRDIHVLPEIAEQDVVMDFLAAGDHGQHGLPLHGAGGRNPKEIQQGRRDIDGLAEGIAAGSGFHGSRFP